MAPDDNAEQHSEPEEIRELRRSFTALGRRFGKLGGTVEFPPTNVVWRPPQPADTPERSQGESAPGLLFIPRGEDEPVTDLRPALPPPTPRPAPAWPRRAGIAAVLVLVFALGAVAGHVLTGSRPSQASAAGAPSPSGVAAPSPTAPAPSPTSAASAAAPAPTGPAPRACLDTAKRADELIAMLIANQRQQAAQSLKAYTLASQECRKEASP
jgi:hypothetical protein